MLYNEGEEEWRMENEEWPLPSLLPLPRIFANLPGFDAKRGLRKGIFTGGEEV